MKMPSMRDEYFDIFNEKRNGIDSEIQVQILI